MKVFYTVLVLAVLFTACKKDKSSSQTDMRQFTVTGSDNASVVPDTVFLDVKNHMISLMFTQDIPPASFPVSFTVNMDLPSGASSDPANGGSVTFNSIDEDVVCTVTAEDGTKADYHILLRDTQIPDADFEDWYMTAGLNGIQYKEPGKSAGSTVWATANSGTSVYSLYCTIPVDTTGGNTVARIFTGSTLLIPITSGTLFTGKFDVNGAIDNPTDPQKATLFGIPFILRPVSFKFTYTFKPGPRYIQATLKNPGNIFGGFNVTDLAGEDKFTAYAVLERRVGSDVTEVGRADFSSSDVHSDFIEVTVPFVYSLTVKPTHISVVFASSKAGDVYTGAEGSTLTIDNLELLY